MNRPTPWLAAILTAAMLVGCARTSPVVTSQIAAERLQTLPGELPLAAGDRLGEQLFSDNTPGGPMLVQTADLRDGE